jgi:hypothetical protein
MKKAAFLILILAIGFSSCSEDEVEPLQSCDTQNVLVDLPWLAELIEEQEQYFIGQNYSYITTGKIKDRRVFVLQNCCPFFASIFPVFNCSGEVLGSIGEEGFEFEDIENYEVIWKSSENGCNFSE